MPAQRGVLTVDQRDQLNRLVRDKSVDAVLALRARLVLWWDDGHSAVQIAQWAGVTDKTARLWPMRYAESGVDGLRGIPHPGKPRTHDDRVRSRIIALSRTSPPGHTGLSHWSSREMAKYLKRQVGIEVSHVFVADLWREVKSIMRHHTSCADLSNCGWPQASWGGAPDRASIACLVLVVWFFVDLRVDFR